MTAQKSPRAMLLDRLAAANINIDSLAIEESGSSVRVTGAIPTDEERQRLLSMLAEAQAEGLVSTHAVEVRPTHSPNNDAASLSALKDPAEPA